MATSRRCGTRPESARPTSRTVVDVGVDARTWPTVRSTAASWLASGMWLLASPESRSSGPRIPPASTTVSGQRCSAGPMAVATTVLGTYDAVRPAASASAIAAPGPIAVAQTPCAASWLARRPSSGSKLDFSACFAKTGQLGHGHRLRRWPADRGRLGLRLVKHPAGRVVRPVRVADVGRPLPGVEAEPAVDRAGRGVDAAHRDGAGRAVARASTTGRGSRSARPGSTARR